MLDIIKESLSYDFAEINDIGIVSAINSSISKRTLTSFQRVGCKRVFTSYSFFLSKDSVIDRN